MKIEDMKTLALSYCMDIFDDYSMAEMMQCTPAIQGAWRIGKEARAELSKHKTAEGNKEK